MQEPNETTEPADTTRRSSHRIAAGVLVALGTLAAFLAVAALWINRQVMDTDNWTESSSQVLEDPAVRNVLSDSLVDQLYANVDVAAEIRSALPPRAQPLAGPAAGAARNLAERAADELLKRPRMQTAWEGANRAAHETFLKIVEGGGPAVSTEGGVVALDVGGMLQQLQAQTGVGGRAAARVQPGDKKITIMESDQLGFAQDVARALRPLAIVLLALTLLFFGGAIAIARDRRRETLRAVGFGFIVAGVLALLVRSAGGDAVVNSLASTEAAVPAAESVWEIYTSLLVQAATACIAYGVFIVLGAWLAGPTRAAVASRRTLAPYLRDPAYAWGATAAFVLLLLLWGPTPALRQPVTALLLIGLLALGVEALRRQTAREFPAAEKPDIGEALRSTVERVRVARPSHTGAPGDGARAPRAGNGAEAADPLASLERLADLHDRGALTDAEFAERKSDLLGVR